MQENLGRINQMMGNMNQQSMGQGLTGQQQGTGPQRRMEMPPAVITTKDLSFLSDAMSWLLVASKKCAHFSQESSQPEAKDVLDRMGQMHQRHFQMLLSHCNHNNMQAMANVPQAPQQ